MTEGGWEALFGCLCYLILSDNLNHICVAAVRKEIQDETDRETGRSKQISSVPIHLSIYSPNGKTEDSEVLPIVAIYYFYS